MPPRQVKIGDAAPFAGTTPRAIRHYHEIGLLPEPERGGDGRRRYGYEDMIRLLWIRRTADAGITLDDIRDAEEGLDGSAAVDDPRVARVAGERYAFECALQAVIEESGLDRDDDALFDAWDALHPVPADDGDEADLGSGRREAGSMSAFEATGRMPYDASPARWRCMELATELSAQDSPATWNTA